MSLYDILITLAIGAVAGWLAGIVMNSKGSLVRNIIIGIIGGVVGGYLFGLLNISVSLTLGPINLGVIIVSAVGACIVLFIVNRIFK